MLLVPLHPCITLVRLLRHRGLLVFVDLFVHLASLFQFRGLTINPGKLASCKIESGGSRLGIPLVYKQVNSGSAGQW